MLKTILTLFQPVCNIPAYYLILWGGFIVSNTLTRRSQTNGRSLCLQDAVFGFWADGGGVVHQCEVRAVFITLP